MLVELVLAMVWLMSRDFHLVDAPWKFPDSVEFKSLESQLQD